MGTLGIKEGFDQETKRKLPTARPGTTGR